MALSGPGLLDTHHPPPHSQDTSPGCVISAQTESDSEVTLVPAAHAPLGDGRSPDTVQEGVQTRSYLLGPSACAIWLPDAVVLLRCPPLRLLLLHAQTQIDSTGRRS